MNIREVFKGALFFRETINQDPYGLYNGFWHESDIVAYRLKDQENGLYIVYDYNYDLQTSKCEFAHCSLVEKQDNGMFARPDKTGVLRSMFKELEDEFTPMSSIFKAYGRLIKFENTSA